MDFSLSAPVEQIDRSIAALVSHGILAELVADKQAALARVRELIPAGASVSTGASLTLRQIGFEDLLISKAHPWKNLKDEFLAEKDPARQLLLRRQAALADYYLGSVHALVETGELLVASATGSQLAPYAFSSSNLIWVVGAQKIVPSFEAGLQRIREYIMPHEEVRMREMTEGKAGTMLGKLLVFERESPRLGRKVHLLLVKEPVGD